MSQYVHHVPGRLRVRCNSLRGNPEKLEAIAETVDGLAGVSGVLVNRRAGSITITYDTDVTERSVLLQTLENLGCKLQQSVRPRQGKRGLGLGVSTRMVGETITRTVVGTLVGTVVKSTLEPSVVSVLKVVRATR